MDTKHALRNMQELKLTLKVLLQYLRTTLVQHPGAVPSQDIQGLFDLLLVFVTQRSGSGGACPACPGCVRFCVGCAVHAVCRAASEKRQVSV
jgi:hypothetical protein